MSYIGTILSTENNFYPVDGSSMLEEYSVIARMLILRMDAIFDVRNQQA